jgi:hypothetical protein
VKPLSANDSVALCHAKVGNRQALKPKAPPSSPKAGLFFGQNLRYTHYFRDKNLSFMSGNNNLSQ